MAGTDTELQQLLGALRQAAERLRDPAADGAASAALVEDCARWASQAAALLGEAAQGAMSTAPVGASSSATAQASLDGPRQEPLL